MPDSAAPRLRPPTDPVERTLEEWAQRLEEWSQPRYRAVQVFRWIHQKGVANPQAMSDLPKDLRRRLLEDGVGERARVTQRQQSSDGTRKLLVELGDAKAVESVLIPQTRTDDEGNLAVAENKLTQCVSSQVGCAMGCSFCASGIAGLKRHLTASEIVAQVSVAKQELARDERLTNLVFMGMGEPLHNYDALVRALTLLSHPDGMNISLRRITVSTSGLVPQIDQLAEDFGGRVQLAISLHAVRDEQRSALMPINRRYPLDALLKALKRYPSPPRARITIEYTLIAGVNDDTADAAMLAALLRGIPVKINLIPMNPIGGTSLGPPQWSSVNAFREVLQAKHLSVFVRRRKGDDIAAACGQLALQGEKPTVQLRRSAAARAQA